MHQLVLNTILWSFDDHTPFQFPSPPSSCRPPAPPPGHVSRECSSVPSKGQVMLPLAVSRAQPPCGEVGHFSRCGGVGHSSHCGEVGHFSRCGEVGHSSHCGEVGHLSRCGGVGHISREMSQFCRKVESRCPGRGVRMYRKSPQHPVVVVVVVQPTDGLTDWGEGRPHSDCPIYQR